MKSQNIALGKVYASPLGMHFKNAVEVTGLFSDVESRRLVAEVAVVCRPGCSQYPGVGVKASVYAIHLTEVEFDGRLHVNR